MTDRASSALADIIGDFDQLYDAYHKGALISDGPGGALAKRLVGEGQDLFRFRRLFLLLDALMRNRVGRLIGGDDGRRHVVVFGGNNVGKSTVVNILAGRRLASVSPEGGHTRHAEAFVPDGIMNKADLFADDHYALRRLTPQADSGLAQAPLDHFGISPLASTALPDNVVLWDTPDCDAVGSESYLLAVIEAVTVADVLVYVTSGEKYSVEHLVEWFLLLAGTGIDALECLNRTPVRDHAQVIESQKTRIFPRAAAALGVAAPSPRVVGLKFMVEGEEDDLWDPRQHPEAEKLRGEVLALVERGRRDPAPPLDFVAAHVERLLEPARIERSAIEGWTREVEEAIRLFAQIYEDAYLVSEKTIDPISRLNVQILELLNPNIPGLQETLSALSWAARWPAKITIKAIGHVYQAVTGGTQKGEAAPKELVAYTDAHTAVLTRLSQAIEAAREEPRHHPFWDALDTAWKDEFDALNDRFVKLVARHMKETDEAIVASARAIIDQLRTRPTLLKTLQGARIAATVGGIMVSFAVPHVGSFAYQLLEESFLAPMMAVGVDAAAQGAIAAFVKKIEVDLVAKLRQEAMTNANALYGEAVNHITQVAKARAGTLGVDPDVLRGLPRKIDELRREFDTPSARIA
ncbi:MAG TPA: GTPase domain-containing protein [Xanthobacteraceae bacterium]|nr:GTPase domain-containing protein [Xanthobacteraceae bacterium]